MSSPTQQLSQWLVGFGDVLERGDTAAAVEMFEPECYWRDLVAFTWNIVTVEGQESIGAMLDARLGDVQPRGWEMQGEATTDEDVVEGWFTYETAVARGLGHARLRGGKCRTLLTTMVELKGFEEKTGHTRIKGTEHGALKGRKTWLELKQQEEAELGYTRQPYCVIIGGGQGGIVLGARLKMLGVPTIIVERNERAGDSWRNRYKSLCLHDPVWYDHLPYIPFPDHWPVFSPKDKMGDWLEMYVKVMELNYWHSTECKGAAYDEAAGQWSVTVDRAGKTVELRPSQLIFATGMSGLPQVPEFPGAETFKGVQHHSGRHAGGEDYKGRKCVVLGSNNSAHDICADLWENDADVTMVQRSPSSVAASETLLEVTAAELYSQQAVDAGIDVDKADLIYASIPYKLLAGLQVPMYDQIREQDAEFYDRLSKAGFLLDFGEDESGLVMKYMRRGSGYYIDVGASQMIIDGKIKLKSGVNIERIKEHAVVLTDGTELSADLIVYATGYGSMNGWAAKLISQEVADRVGKCWGLGSETTKDPGPWEGELRNMWKPTHQPGLWFHGGNLHQSRHYSQFLALQLKARMEGMDTTVYGMGPVHHLS